MAQQNPKPHAAEDASPGRLSFLIDTNLGLDVAAEPWKGLLSAAGLDVEQSTDLPYIDRLVAEHRPDVAYIPMGSFYRLFGRGDQHYRGLAQATSKMTGSVLQTCFLVVGKDDPANSIADLSGARFGFINRSCSSSFFPPAILLNRLGRNLDDFLDMVPVEPGPTWQGLVDAVISHEVRATMVLEDTWNAQPRNAEHTRVIERYTRGPEAVVVARDSLDEKLRKSLLDALLATVPGWDTVYGSFKPFYYADVHAYFHDLGQLPSGLL